MPSSWFHCLEYKNTQKNMFTSLAKINLCGETLFRGRTEVKQYLNVFKQIFLFRFLNSLWCNKDLIFILLTLWHLHILIWTKCFFFYTLICLKNVFYYTILLKKVLYYNIQNICLIILYFIFVLYYYLKY